MKKATIYSLAIIFIFLSFDLIGQNYSANFKIRDSKTGYAVNSKINIENKTTHSIQELLTEKHGQADFIGQGQFNYQVIADGYKPIDSYFTLSNSAQTLNIEVLLTPISTNATSNSEDLKTVVSGYVVDKEEGTPLKGVTVSLQDLGIEVKTDNRGFYKFDFDNNSDFSNPNFKPVRHILSFQKNGFTELSIQDYIFFQGNLNFNAELNSGEGIEIEKYKQGLFDRISSDIDNHIPINELSPISPTEILACNVPTSIRVGTSCSCTTCSNITTMTLEEYVQKGLDNEWIASWNSASLYAGAVAYRTYGAYFVNNSVNSNFDIAGSTCNQAFDATSYSSCIAAAQNTSGQVMVSGSSIVKCEYSAENNGNPSCGTSGFTGNGVSPWTCKSDVVCSGITYNGHGRGMCQWGSKRWGDQGKTYTWILDNYYTRAGWSLCTGSVILPPVNDNCPGSTLTSSTSCNYLPFTVTGATASGKSKPNCDVFTGTSSLLDVWFSFIAASTTHTINIRPQGTMDAVVSVYNSCTATTPISGGCKDDSGVGTITDFNVTGLTIGNTYYIRVYDYGNTAPANGGFNICVAHQVQSCNITLSTNTVNVSPTATTASFIVTVSPFVCVWSSTGTSACGITLFPSGGGGGTVSMSFIANNSPSEKRCTFFINGQPITLIQAAGCSPPSAPTPSQPGGSVCGQSTVFEKNAPINFSWSGVSNAIGYDLNVSQYPYGTACGGSNNNVQLASCVSNTTFLAAASNFKPGILYRWNVQAYSQCNNDNCKTLSANALYFQIRPDIYTNSSPNICAGQSVMLQTDAITVNSPGIVTYKWYRGTAEVYSGPNNTYAATIAGTYTLKLLYTGSGCCPSQLTTESNSISVNITPSVMPSVSISPSSTTICSGQNVTFTATPANGGSSPTYQWFLNGGQRGTNSPTYTTENLTSNAQVYCVMTSNADCRSANTAQSTPVSVITVTPALEVPIIAGNNSICEGETTTLSVSNPCSNCIYTWQPNNSQGRSIDVSSTGTFSVKATNGNCTSEKSQDVVVMVKPKPVPMPTANPSTINVGQSSLLTANGGGTYQWSTNPPGSNASGTVSPTTTTTYTVTVTNNGCSATASTTVTVNIPCTFTVSPMSITIPPTGMTNNLITVTASSQTCPWTPVYSCTGFLLNRQPSNMTGNGRITFDVGPNNTMQPIVCDITIGDKVVRVTQEATVPCAVTTNPVNSAVGYQPSTGIIDVTTSPTGCSWTASLSSNCSWITLTQSTGNGTGQVRYSYQENPNTTPRTCDIIINGKIHTITQEGKPCTYTTDIPAINVSHPAIVTSFKVITNLANCSWTAAIQDIPNNLWLTINPSSGTGSATNNTVNVSIAACENTSNRQAMIKITGQNGVSVLFPVIQICTGYTCDILASKITRIDCDLLVPNQSNVTYQWFKDNIALQGAAQRLYTIVGSGKYHCKITKTIAPICSITSDTINVAYDNITGKCTTCDILPSTITRVSCNLSVPIQLNVSYQWFKDNISLGTAANQQLYPVIGPGKYHCRITKTIDPICSITSDTINVAYDNITGKCTVSNNEVFGLNGFILYPNPNHGSFSIEFELLESKNIGVKVYNTIGQQVYNKMPSKFIGKYKQQVSLKDVSSGVYFVVVELDGQKVTKSILVD